MRSYPFAALVVAGCLFLALERTSGGQDNRPTRDGTTTASRQGQSGPRITISKETTHFTGPLDESGMVDYVAAVNAQSRRGVTRENNAAILFWQAAGPATLRADVRTAYLQPLGLAALPDRGDYFMPWSKYVQQAPRGQRQSSQSPDAEAILARLDEARRWPWRPADRPTMARWLASNKEPLDLLVEATKRTRFYVPLVNLPDQPGMFAAQLPHASLVRPMTRTLMARAMLRLGANDLKGAWQDTLACHRLARLVWQGPTLMEALVAYSLDEFAFDGIGAMTHHGKFKTAVARRFSSDLRKLPRFPPISEKLDRGERAVILDTAWRIARGGPDELQNVFNFVPSMIGKTGRRPIRPWPKSWRVSADFQWTEVLRLVNEATDRWVASTGMTPSAKRWELTEQLDGQIAGAWQNHRLRGFGRVVLASGFIPNDMTEREMADFFVATLGSSPMAALLSDDFNTMRGNMWRMVLALGAFRAKRGAYPRELSELVPNYLRRLPKDIFTAQDFRYRRQGQGFVLYGVGSNDIDDGGTPPSDTERGDRPLVLVPRVVQTP